jgi:hypothetical protein
MEPNTDTTAQGRRNRSSNTAASQSAPPTYGYHNTYHTHAQLPLGAPPAHPRAHDSATLRHLEEKARSEAEVACRTALPPAYSCSVEMSGVLGVRQELSSPFQVSGCRDWYDAFVVLQGTQLSIYRVKYPGLLSKSRKPTKGRFIQSYTLQHAEVGVASDFRKTALIPKSPLAHLIPASTRQKLYETDPHMFEPVREHVIRLRLETEQFLICPTSQESMLNWIESLCAAIDISSPLEDRSEPRYRSLPRRSRRQRILDSAQLGENIENLSSLEAGRRIIAQQEQIIRQLYPHLAGAREPATITTTITAGPADLELDEFDPEDVRFPTSRSARDSLTRVSSHEEDEENRPSSSFDRKNSERIRPSPSQTQRYRRRCAPVLLAASPRVSDVVFSAGTRMRIDVKKHVLVEYTSHPPRYDAHNFPKSKRPTKLQLAARLDTPVVLRPREPIREVSEDSITSVEFEGEEGPPSPTGSGTMMQIKADAARRIAEMGKVVEREVVVGVGLLV